MSHLTAKARNDLPVLWTKPIFSCLILNHMINSKSYGPVSNVPMIQIIVTCIYGSTTQFIVTLCTKRQSYDPTRVYMHSWSHDSIKFCTKSGHIIQNMVTLLNSWSHNLNYVTSHNHKLSIKGYYHCPWVALLITLSDTKCHLGCFLSQILRSFELLNFGLTIGLKCVTTNYPKCIWWQILWATFQK